MEAKGTLMVFHGSLLRLKLCLLEYEMPYSTFHVLESNRMRYEKRSYSFIS